MTLRKLCKFSCNSLYIYRLRCSYPEFNR